MATPPVIKNGDCVELYAELPDLETKNIPLFSLMGHEWTFHFAGSNQNYVAYVYRKICMPKFRPFKFDVDVGLVCEKNFKSLGKRSVAAIKINETYEVFNITQTYMKSVLPSNYQGGNIVKFSFRFILPIDPVLQLIQSKSGDKCVQTGLNLNTESLSEDFSKLLETGLNHDLKIKCKNHSLKVHKLVLCARSAVFKAMLQSDMREARSGVLEIQDIDAVHFQDFVKYLYTDALPELTFDKAKTLYEAGDKYAVRSLVLRFGEYLKDTLCLDNVFECFALANAHSDQNLMNGIVSYIVKEKIYLQDEHWLPFCESYPKVAIEVYRLSQKKL